MPNCAAVFGENRLELFLFLACPDWHFVLCNKRCNEQGLTVGCASCIHLFGQALLSPLTG